MPCDVDMIETYWNWRCGLSPIIDSYLSILENIIIRGMSPQLLKHCLGLGVRSILYWPTWVTFARMVIHPKCVYHLSAKDVNGCISKPNTSLSLYIYIRHHNFPTVFKKWRKAISGKWPNITNLKDWWHRGDGVETNCPEKPWRMPQSHQSHPIVLVDLSYSISPIILYVYTYCDKFNEHNMVSLRYLPKNPMCSC